MLPHNELIIPIAFIVYDRIITHYDLQIVDIRNSVKVHDQVFIVNVPRIIRIYRRASLLYTTEGRKAGSDPKGERGGGGGRRVDWWIGQALPFKYTVDFKLTASVTVSKLCKEVTIHDSNASCATHYILPVFLFIKVGESGRGEAISFQCTPLWGASVPAGNSRAPLALDSTRPPHAALSSVHDR